MWSLPAWTRACEKKLSGALARTQKPKSYPQEEKSPCGKKDPCFFPRARGIVPSLSGRKNPRKNQNFPTRFPKQDARSNFETKPDERTRKLQARDWFFWIFWPNRNIFWIPYRISSSSPDLPTYEAKTHKEEAGPSQNCGRKKKNSNLLLHGGQAMFAILIWVWFGKSDTCLIIQVLHLIVCH